MRFDRLLLPPLFALLGVVSSQSFSGLTFDARGEVTLIWAFDGETSGRYDLYLCAGDESTGSYKPLERVIDDGAFTPGDWVSFRVDPSVGGNDPNAYFLKVVPSDSKNQWSGFTSHFTLTNMKGTFSTQISKAIKSMRPVELQLMDLAPEARLLDGTEKLLRYNGSSLDGGLAEEAMKSFLQFPTPTIAHDLGRNELRKRLRVDPHNIPYGEQTGPTKYAPMPKRAGSTIADRSPTPQYPPFPFSIATTYLPAPTVQYTDTAYLTWTTHSIENTAAPAAAPTLDKRMQMWLERWKD